MTVGGVARGSRRGMWRLVAFCAASIVFGVLAACAGAAQFYRLSCSPTDATYCLLPNNVNGHDQVVGDFVDVSAGEDSP